MGFEPTIPCVTGRCFKPLSYTFIQGSPHQWRGLSITQRESVKIGKMMDRYGIEGASYGNPRMGGTQRSMEDVNKDIAKAMMYDYDSRSSMEASAMAGDKDAGKFAKKGFKGGNIYSAYDKMKQMKKEYVGGGGMRGAKNEAGLTQAIVQADRDKMLADLDEKYGQKEETPTEPADDIGKKADVVLSNHMERAKGIVDDWEKGNQDVYTDNSAALTQATGIKESEPPSDTAPPSNVPVDLTNPDEFYNTKMNAYKSRFNLVPDF